MADRWIVSRYKFCEHPRLVVAEKEANRLSEKVGTPFHIYRIKTTLESSKTVKRTITGLKSIVAMGKEHKLADAQRIAALLLSELQSDKE